VAGYLLAILGLAVLCGAWVAFQLWLRKSDPEGVSLESRCGHCDGGCSRGSDRPHHDSR